MISRLVHALVVLSAVSWLAAPARADHPDDNADDSADAARAGHSLHGDAFNEGPRQAAYLMEGMPKINFPVTTRSAEAQKFFNQGVGQLHGFWYFEAERSFRQAAALDTNCAMAYWGMAMANVNNPKRAKEFTGRAVGMTNGLGRRECLWIESMARFHKIDDKSNRPSSRRREGGTSSSSSTNKTSTSSAPTNSAPTSSAASADPDRYRTLVRGLEQIIEEFPDDLEAKAFLVGRIWENQRSGLRITSHTAVDALANEVLAADPMHPVHHYRIHLWDEEKAHRALNSAALCGQGSPGVAHMWHMPGHIYSRLHRYADAAWQQEASARVDHAHMMRDRVLPDQIHNYAHNNEWLIRTLSNQGRAREAIDLAKNMIELPRHPTFNTLTAYLNPTNDVSTNSVQAYQRRTSSARHGRSSLATQLVKFELWDQAIALADTTVFEPTDIPDEQVRRLQILGTAYFEKGDDRQGADQITALETVLKVQREQRRNAADEAEDKARTNKLSDDKLAAAMTEALRSHASRIKSTEKAITELKALRRLASTNDVSKETLEELKDLPKERLARIHLRAGDKEKAERYAREAANSATNQVQPLANYVDMLWRVGKTNEALKSFAQLRVVAAAADLDPPILRRLAPVAEAQGWPTDWRTPPPAPADVGRRPDLDSLGPFRWQPSPAPEWSLYDDKERRVSLKQYRGKPVVMMFYLGYGCIHCLEQLNAFAPATKEFAAEGISLLAVSVDSTAGLAKTLEQSTNGGGFPFPLLSDESRDVFKQYRAFDDFEQRPMHGTFLIDGAGLVRWQDIGFEPFTDTRFLLAEAKRLLGLTSKPGLAKAKATKTKTPAKTKPLQSKKGAEKLISAADRSDSP